ncbi:MAG TPA: DUF1573 domain-containing protein [Planctomycetaceae bacterium]|jgi:hypothetical protein|nr:DUF1573 domain-containing protein [Planctomycetaceae bacterium]
MNRTLGCSLLMLPLMFGTGAGLSQPARAQNVVAEDPYDWAKKMFDSTEHNFGVVARGSEVTHRFRIKNLYKEDVQISTVSTTCGCTTPQFDRDAVKTGGELYVTITMDTNKFQHQKNSTVTVQFAQPRFAEVRIPVEVYIRSDVVLTPGSINFGAVAAGTKTDRSIEIAYAGRANWQITKVITGDPNVEAKVVQTARDNVSQVGYRLDVSLLPGTPVGNLRKQMTLVTDDATGGEIPVIVQARVEGDVTITPSIVQLGTVGPGSDTTKTVLLRSNKPFVIEKVECDSNRQAFRMPALGKEAKPVHVLSLAFTAPTQIGPFTEKFIVTIAGRPEPLYFTAQGTIEGAPAAQAARP